MKHLLMITLFTAAFYSAVSAATLLTESFEGSFPPTGWTQTSVQPKTTYAHSGTNSAYFSATSDDLITPPLTNAQSLTFWSYTSSADPDIIVETSTNLIEWTAVSQSPFFGSTEQWNEHTVSLDTTETLYVKFRKSGIGSLYIDDISASDEQALQPEQPDLITFDFAGDAVLYAMLDDQSAAVTVTNSGLVATITPSEGAMNRTADGFGVNATNLVDDTDAIDPGEWVELRFENVVTLTNITVSSWGPTDSAIVFVNGTSNSVITASGSHAFNILVPANQTLRIAGAGGEAGNGWSLDRITVKPGAPAAPAAPLNIALSSQAGRPTVTWNAGTNQRYTVHWTPNLQAPFQPIATNDAPVCSWTDTTHTNAPSGFYKINVQETGTGSGDLGFSEGSFAGDIDDGDAESTDT